MIDTPFRPLHSIIRMPPRPSSGSDYDVIYMCMENGIYRENG